MPTSSGSRPVYCAFQDEEKEKKRKTHEWTIADLYGVDPSKLNFIYVFFSHAEPQLYQEVESNAMR